MTFLEKQLAKLKAVSNMDSVKSASVKVPVKDVNEPYEFLCNIRKRSLPPGIDKMVLFNIPVKDAERWIKTRLKARIINDGRTVIYYDTVPVNPIGNEESIFYNTKPVTKEAPHDF